MSCRSQRLFRYNFVNTLFLGFSIFGLLATGTIARAAEPLATKAELVADDLDMGSPGADEGELRYGPRGPIDILKDYSDSPLPLRTWAANDPVLPVGRLVTRNLRTGKTLYSNVVRPDLPETERFVHDGTVNRTSRDWVKNFTPYEMVADPTLPEYRNKVRMFTTFINAVGDTVNSACSGTLIGPTTIITAGHCLFDGVPSGTGGTSRMWAHKIKVIPAYGHSRLPYGDSYATQLHSWEGWVGDEDFDHDIGIIELDRPVGSLTGWDGFGVDGDCDFFTSGAWTSSGYPGTNGYNGVDMYTRTGNYDDCETFGNEVSYDRANYRGASGTGAIKNVAPESGVVWAVASNASGGRTWDTRITANKFSDIAGIISAQHPPTVDFIPLTFELADTVATIGGFFPSSSFRVCSTSETIYDGWVDFDLYISTDNNISTADVRLASYHVNLNGIGATLLAEKISLAGSMVPASLLPGKYFMGVIITSDDWNADNNDTDYWDIAPIELICETPAATTLTSPADQSVCQDQSVTFSWGYVPGAVAYNFVISSSAVPMTYYETSTNSLTIPNLELGEYYWWRVAAVGSCEDLSAWSEVWALTIREPLPDTPLLVYPANDESCQSVASVILDWDDVERATGYLLKIGTSCGTGSVYSPAASEQTITNMSSGTTYHWSVRATDECGQMSAWSECRSYATAPFVTTISGLRTPFYSESEITVPVLLDWEDIAGAEYYYVRVGSAPGVGLDYLCNESEFSMSDLEYNSTYYWSVRPYSTCAQAGSWSSSWPFTTTGPGANLTFATNAGWSAPVVPRTLNDATPAYVPAPVTLLGDSLSTLWNFDGINDGDLSASGFQSHLRVDGEYEGLLIRLSTAAGERFPINNYSPTRVRAGRHTFECYLDANDNIAEQHEGDNGWAQQRAWQPVKIPASIPKLRRAPPDMAGGHESIPWTEPVWPNCDGVRFTTSGWWNAVVVHDPSGSADYDVGLHTATATPEYGFDYFQAISLRPIGCTDAVLVNRNVVGYNEDWDVGIFRQTGTSDYQIVHTVSSSVAFGDSILVNMAHNEMLALREVSVTAADTGWVSFIVDVDPAAGPVYVNWLDATFDKGGLLNYSTTGVTDSLGHLALRLYVPEVGYYCAVIYRDPVGGKGPVDVGVVVGPPVPDLAVATSPGWYAPIVPRVAADAGYPIVSLDAPAYLLGDTVGTHYYASIYNDSPVAIPAYNLSIQKDGDFNTYYNFSSLSAYDTRQFHGGSLMWVKGGLHTLALVLDPQAGLAEAWENNNAHGEQWSWIPVEHAVDEPGSRGTPPDKTGGWSTIPAGVSVWPNADGIRTPQFSPIQSRKWIVGTAILPLSADADYDLTLHPKDDNAATGFRVGHVTSSWGAAQSDFAVARLRHTAEHQWDIGVTKNAGNGTYLYHTTEGVNLGIDPMGDLGTSRIDPNEILNLYETYLSPGSYIATVRNDSGTVDWGVSIIDNMVDYAGKSDTYQDGSSAGISWLAGAGLDETVEFEVFASGYYGLAVWKVGSADALKGGKYTLQLVNQASAVPANDTDLAVVSAISSVWPNPCNPLTTISFDIASNDRLDISVFDVRGRHVKTLDAGSRPVGSHQVAWNGMDQNEQPVTSGIYFVRLKIGTIAKTRKITLVR